MRSSKDKFWLNTYRNVKEILPETGKKFPTRTGKERWIAFCESCEQLLWSNALTSGRPRSSWSAVSVSWSARWSIYNAIKYCKLWSIRSRFRWYKNRRNCSLNARVTVKNKVARLFMAHRVFLELPPYGVACSVHDGLAAVAKQRWRQVVDMTTARGSRVRSEMWSWRGCVQWQVPACDGCCHRSTTAPDWSPT